MAKTPAKTPVKQQAKAPAKTGTALAKPRTTAVAHSDADMFGSVAGMGMEKVTTRDLIIPRIGILQKMSPELARSDAKFIKGAKEGDFCNIGMNEVLPSPLNFIPCFFQKQFLEWTPRKSGGGLAGIHDDDSIMRRTRKNDEGQNVLPNKNYIVETSQLYVILLLADDVRMPAFIPFVSTQHKKVRQLLTDSRRIMIQRSDGSKFNPPMFYRSWEATTVEENNAQGDWMGWKLVPVGPISELENAREVFDHAKEFTQQCIDGVAKADHSEEDATAGAYGGGGDDDGDSDDDSM